jgi:hypothetical protein
MLGAYTAEAAGHVIVAIDIQRPARELFIGYVRAAPIV